MVQDYISQREESTVFKIFLVAEPSAAAMLA